MERLKRAWLFTSIVASHVAGIVADRACIWYLWIADKNIQANRWMTKKLTIHRWYLRWLMHGCGFGLTMLAAGMVLLLTTMPNWQETDDIWNIKKQYSITFLDRNGEVLGHRGGAMDTTYSIQDYPPHLIRAVIATEDQRFYSHHGLDPIGIIGAFIHNYRNPSAREKGGSTITQQVVKNIWLTPERSLGRKIKEAWLALWLENHATKDEILRLYFERSYMGAGNYGLAAASQYYFNKPVTEVTIPEAAMLAGLFKAPVSYSPSSNLDTSLQRMQVVLGILKERGLIDPETYGWAMTHDPRVRKEDQRPNEWAIDYAYLEAVRLINDLGLGNHRSFTVRTTLDKAMQAHADQLIKQVLDEHGYEYEVSQASLVSMGVDGSVRTIVGGLDYQSNQFNRAISARRQPGSSFKPFVYMTALLGGWTPDTRVNDSPVTLSVFGKPWTPANYDDKYFGDVTLREALQRSLNTVAVKIMMKFGRQSIVDVAHDAGIQSELKTVASLPLGSNEVTLMELTNAYTTFAAGGQNQPPWVVVSMEAGGKTVYTHANDRNLSMIFPAEVNKDMVGMLNGVVERGTATRAKLGVPVAGKTGTTSDYNDAWFIGFTGNLVTGVWMGNDDNTKMVALTGGNLPAQLWHDYMAVAEAKETPRGLPGIDYRPPTAIDPGQLSERKPPKKQPQVAKAQETSIETPKPSEPVKQPNFIEKLFGVLPQ